MDSNTANSKMVTRLLFRLLPVQIMLAAVGTVNGLVSTFFASNYLGLDATTALGLYAPLLMLLTAANQMLAGGSAFLCGKHLGSNDHKGFEEVFASTLAAAVILGLAFTIAFMLAVIMGVSGHFIADENVRRLFDIYLLGQAAGVVPLMIGNQLAPFLLLENKERRSVAASLAFVAVNFALNILFVNIMNIGILGIALAFSIGMVVFCMVQAQYFISSRSYINYYRHNINWSVSWDVVRLGNHDAANSIYQTVRGFIVNYLVLAYIGSAGISAFTASDNLMRLIWSVPTAMLVVSRMLTNLSIGEEDRRTLTDVMRNMFYHFVPLMFVISLLIIALAKPLSLIFFRDTSSEVYEMTVWGFRIMPLCMPFAVISMHFISYGGSSGKDAFTTLISVLDGVACVSVFTLMLIAHIGMNSVYVAYVLGGVVTTLVIIACATINKKHFPRNMDDLMMIDDDFGIEESERMDISVQSIEEVVNISEQIQQFCQERGVDNRKAHLAGLYMEEMAGNIVDHGFTKDNKKHTIDARVVHKGDEVILRIKDDCVPFDPRTRSEIASSDDITRNIGIRMVFNMAKDFKYRNIMGMNVLTIRI